MKKNKVKNFLKNNLKIMLTIIITTVIVGVATTFASYTYFAKDVKYKKSDGTDISVEDALNELYNTRKIAKIEKIYQSIESNINYTYI